MKKALLLILLTSFGLMSYGQSHEKGDIVFNAGLGFGLYSGTYSDNTSSNSSLFLLGVYPIKLEYGVLDRFSAGILLQPMTASGNDTDDNGVLRSYKFGGSFIAPAFNFHFLPKKKTDMYFGIAPGYIGMNFTAEDVGGPNKDEAKFSGFGFKADLGFRFYIKNLVSINVNLAYMSANQTLRSHTDNGVKNPNPVGKFNFGGVEPSFGVGVKF